MKTLYNLVPKEIYKIGKSASVNLFNDDTPYVDINELFLDRFGYVPNVLTQTNEV